jgi:transcriptional regulator with XRE-family HTH domain|nr:MAG TPA: helix-turn-helix domain protein [Caudoviricetes sp.]
MYRITITYTRDNLIIFRKTIRFNLFYYFNTIQNLIFAVLLNDTLIMELRIREILESKDIKVSSLAETVGITRANMSNIVNGKSTPSLETLEKIANALGVDITELFTPSSSGSIIGVIRIGKTNYNINSVPDLSNLLDRIEKGEIVL